MPAAPKQQQKQQQQRPSTGLDSSCSVGAQPEDGEAADGVLVEEAGEASDGVLVSSGASDGVLIPEWLQACCLTAMEDGRILACSRQELQNLFAASPSALREPNASMNCRPTIAFCQTCLGRGFQLKLSLAVNLAVTWRFREKCHFFLVVFDPQNPDTQDLLTWIQANLQPALKKGFLNVCVGNMHFWDCSVAKNTSHVFALETLKGKGCDEPYLMNLDGDNIIKEAWLPWLFDLLEDERVGLHMFGGMDGGCTGRVGIWKLTFVAIHGYEESLPYPSGYQDIEIGHRAKAYHGFCRAKFGKKQKSYPGCGYSIPNADDWKIALAEAKVVNCDAERCGKLSWGAQNTKNMEYCHEKKGRPSMQRHGSLFQ